MLLTKPRMRTRVEPREGTVREEESKKRAREGERSLGAGDRGVISSLLPCLFRTICKPPGSLLLGGCGAYNTETPLLPSPGPVVMLASISGP